MESTIQVKRADRAFRWPTIVHSFSDPQRQSPMTNEILQTPLLAFFIHYFSSHAHTSTRAAVCCPKSRDRTGPLALAHRNPLNNFGSATWEGSSDFGFVWWGKLKPKPPPQSAKSRSFVWDRLVHICTHLQKKWKCDFTHT